MTAASVSPATSAELLAASRALFAPLAPEVTEVRAERVRLMIAEGDVDPAGLLVARVRGRVVGAVLVQFHPGRTAVVSPPGAADPAVADLLARTVTARLGEAGVVQAQSVVPPAERNRADPLERTGFRQITQLVFLCRPTADAPLFDPADSPLMIGPVTEPNPRFAAVLAATYENTLDCPELDGTRSIEDVVAAYQAAARGPLDWVLASTGTGPAGVVILTAGARPGTRELSYIGLVPAARGRGLGRWLLRYALQRAREVGAEWLTLSVDERNEPAMQLYRSHGFREYDRQAVLLWTAGP